MNKGRCPQCDSEAAFFLQTSDLNHKITNDLFKYYRCRRCGLIFLSPIPPDLKKYYGEAYFAHQVPRSPDELLKAPPYIQWQLDLVRRFKESGRMLEIGASFGAFAYSAQRAGFRVDAIEMDEGCCNFMNQRTQIRAIHTTDVLGSILKIQEKYDVIVLWQNIEHLTNPWEVLKQCSKMIVRDGLLVIATPNPESIQFKMFKEYWFHVDAPRHVELISVSLLTRFLNTMGMNLVFKTFNDPHGLLCDLTGWQMSVQHWLGSFRGKESLSYRVANSILNMNPVLKLFKIIRHGTTYTAVFRKSNA